MVIFCLVSLFNVSKYRYARKIIEIYTNKSAPLATQKNIPKLLSKSGLITNNTTAPVPKKNTKKCNRLNFFLSYKSIENKKKTNHVTITINCSKFIGLY
jgi:hypothetical protein